MQWRGRISGENQLQSSVDQAYCQWCREQYGEYYCAVLQSQPEENASGWDTAYYIDWLGPKRNESQFGCNLFVQYKMSELVKRRDGREWPDWRRPYLRFDLRVQRRRLDGTWSSAFHQLAALRDLADAGYEVYYVTNVVQTRGHLFDLLSAGLLLEHTPFLDVRDLSEDHAVVSFTEDSDMFLLHSEPTRVAWTHWRSVEGKLLSLPRGALSDSNSKVLDAMLPHLLDRDARGLRRSLADIRRRDVELQSAQTMEWYVLRYYLWFFLDIHMYWFPCTRE